ncbi:jg26076, partial [Pararge aegeria aegeria]
VLIPVVVLDDINEAEKETSNADDKMEREIEVVVEVENEDEGRVKADTNFSKSRVKVSPYRRSTRLADNTNTSLLANYT